MSGLKDDRGRVAGVALAVVLVAVGIAGVVYELRSPPPAPAPAPVAAPVAAPAPTATTAPAAPAAEEDSCNFPGPVPGLPHGDSATAEDMKTQHDAIQGFVQALESYQSCENDKANQMPDEESKKRFIARGNRAVDEAHALANAFAAQLKAFHEKRPEPLPEK